MCAFISFQGLLVCTMDGSAKQLELKKQNKKKKRLQSIFEQNDKRGKYLGNLLKCI